MIENILRGKMHTPDLIDIGPGCIGIVMQIRSAEKNIFQRSEATEIVKPGNVGIWDQVLGSRIWIVDNNAFEIVILKRNNDFEGNLRIIAQNGSRFTINLSANFCVHDAAAINLIKNIPYTSVHKNSNNGKIMTMDNVLEAGLIELYTKEVNATQITKHDLKIETSPERSVGLLRKYIADITARIEEQIKNNGITVRIAIKHIEATITA
jgi:hypothetical protein